MLRHNKTWGGTTGYPRVRMQLFQELTGLVKANNRHKQISDTVDPEHLMNSAYASPLELVWNLEKK